MIVTPITPRVSETDGAGHINNCFVPVWFEAGRRKIFQVLNPELEFKQWHAVLVNMSVEYEAQIYYSDDVEVRTWVEKIGNKSFTVGEEIWQQSKRCAKGRAIYVYFDQALQRSVRVPENLVKKLETAEFSNHS